MEFNSSDYNKKSNNTPGVIVLSSESLLPLLCAAVTFKYSYNYYSFIFPSLTSIFIMLYNLVTLFMLVLFIPLAAKVLINLKIKEYRILLPALLIPICVVINILYVAITTGDASVFSRSYYMAAAYGTNDVQGFYFSQINTWFGNIAVLLALAIYIKNRKDIVNCIAASMCVLIVPIILIIIAHPSYLGLRQSSFDNGTKFSGGLWNIGVVGFGSISWISLAVRDWASKWQRRVIFFSIALFVFVGVAGISRTLILMIAFSVIFHLLMDKKDMGWLSRVFLVMFTIGLFIIIESDLVNSLLFRFNDSTSGTNNIRIKLWKAYLSHYREYWLIGAPVGSVYRYYRDVNLFGEYFLPHSALINFFVRYGIVAVVSYVILLKRTFLIRKIPDSKAAKRNLYIMAGGISYITLAFINQTGYAEPIFYIMFGLVLAYHKLDRWEQVYEGRNCH